MISKETLEKRLLELTEQLNKAFGVYQAVSGAIQECEHMIAQCDESKKDSK